MVKKDGQLGKVELKFKYNWQLFLPVRLGEWKSLI